jgi:hypothetical protein
MTNKPRSKVAQAYEIAFPVRQKLHAIGRCMEVTEDKCGIIWERWLIGTSQVVVFATPHFVEVFSPLTTDPTWEGVAKALDEFKLKQQESQ